MTHRRMKKILWESEAVPPEKKRFCILSLWQNGFFTGENFPKRFFRHTFLSP